MNSVFSKNNPELFISDNCPPPEFTLRPLNILIGAPDKPTAATAFAERMVIANRENVRFLNRHLQAYRDYLELPSLADNALYLAYTVRVRKDAPFSTDQLRAHLKAENIETKYQYDFFNRAEIDSPYANRLTRDLIDDKTERERSFCLPCHHQLSIQDLMCIVAAVDRFMTEIIIREAECS